MSYAHRGEAIEHLSRQLRGLPRQEMVYADLKRRQEIDAEIYSTVFSRYNEARVAEAATVADVYIMDHAVAPIPPNPMVRLLQVIGLATLLGAAVALIPPVTMHLLDRTARSETQVMKHLDIPVLESVPHIKPAVHRAEVSALVDPKLITHTRESAVENEFFWSLRAKLDLVMESQRRHIVAFTSLQMSEGKTIIAANAAIAFARQGKRVVLIDADLRRGALFAVFGVNRGPGLADYLLGKSERGDIASMVQETPVPQLDIIASGPLPVNSIETLSSERMLGLIEDLSRRYDYVFIDTPPLGVGADVASLHRTGCLFCIVVKSGATDMFHLGRRLDEYPFLRKHLAGVVLNFSILDSKQKYFKYSSYYRSREFSGEGRDAAQE
jgi:tyrosine-protein kinase Etk/Wzc